jgi:hypothetical protein
VKKFVNEDMDAPNVIKVPVDLETIEELKRISASEKARRRLYSTSPAWGSDIRWYSPRTKRDFDVFKSIFERLGIAGHVKQYIDLDRDIRLYNSFFVIRSECSQANFHVDWDETNNEGFTMMTPLTENCSGFGMLYKRRDGSIGEYDYKMGEALIFGDDFLHSTKPGTSSDPIVLLCFNFGSDKMEHWQKIERTAAHQSLLICRPDGRFHRIPLAKRLRHALARVLRKLGLLPLRSAQAGY